MLAPPERRRKRKPVAERRADDRRRKRRQLKREKLGLYRCELWLTTRAVEGLIQQLISTRQLTDEQALSHRNVEKALTALIEAQGERWAQ